MEFEHFEGITPDQKFDRLGKEGYLNFLSKKLPEDLTDKKDKPEKLSYREERIESLKAQIVELKEKIRTWDDEETRLSPGSLQETDLELKDKEMELNALEAKSQLGDKKDLVDKDLQASLN